MLLSGTDCQGELRYPPMLPPYATPLCYPPTRVLRGVRYGHRLYRYRATHSLGVRYPTTLYFPHPSTNSAVGGYTLHTAGPAPHLAVTNTQRSQRETVTDFVGGYLGREIAGDTVRACGDVAGGCEPVIDARDSERYGGGTARG
eukprot:2475714-Rhodomonas_salina.2